MSVLVIVFVAAATLLVYYNFIKDRKFWEKMSKIKGKPTLPIIGNVHQFRTTLHGRFADLANLTEEMNWSPFKLKFGLDNLVVLSSAEDIEVFMKSTTQINKPKEYRFLDSWIGEGLLTACGEKWRRQRKVITPTFHFKILEQFVYVFDIHTTELVKQFESKQKKIIDVYPLVNNYSLDAICETTMGVKVSAQQDAESDYVKAVSDICEVIMSRIFSGLSRIQWIFELTNGAKRMKDDLVHLHGLRNRVINGKREELKEEIEAVFSSTASNLSQHVDNEKKKYHPFIELLLLSKLPNGSPIDDMEIKDNVDTFIFAGHDTTSAGISFALYNLSRHPEVQRQAFEEQLEMFGSDWKKNPTYSDLMGMKYLERVIKESLRLHPSVPNVGREVTEDTHLPDGTVIPKGVTLLLHIYALHRNPKYFTNPQKFDPDRFLEDREKIHPYAYIPFSAGLRNCIGQKFAILEMKMAISKVLRRFELQSAGPELDVILNCKITLQSSNGIHMKIADRKY